MTSKPIGSACALLIALAICRGSAYGFTKLALHGFSPGTVVFLRFAFGAAVFLIVATAMFRDLNWIKFDWLGVVFHAVVGNLLPITLITVGQQSVPSGLAAVAMALTPLFSAGLAHALVPNEHLNRRSVLGLMIGFAGVLAIVLTRGEGRAGTGMLFGFLALSLAAMCFAVQLIFARKWSSRNPVGTSALSLLIAAVASAPFMDGGEVLAAGANQIASTGVGLGVVGTALAMLAMLMLTRRATTVFASTVNYLIPVVGLVVGSVFFDEPIYWHDIGAFALIVLGTALVQSHHSSNLARPSNGTAKTQA